MCDYNKNAISHPELSAEKGWTELEIPDSYGKGGHLLQETEIVTA